MNGGGKNRHVFGWKHFGAIYSEAGYRNHCNTLKQLIEGIHTRRVFGIDVTFCFFTGVGTGKEFKCTGTCKFKQKSRFSTRIVGSGEEYIGVQEYTLHLDQERRLRIAERWLSSSRSSVSH